MFKAVIVVGLATVMSASACGSDADDPAPVTESPIDQTVPLNTEVGDDSESGAASATLTGAQICELLVIDSVAADLGLEVTDAEPDDSGTPQCAYKYTNATGVSSNLTVAAMRPEDVGGASGEAAFDFVAGINRSIAGDDAEEQQVSAGDNALRLSGPALHLGIVQLGDHVYTLIVPAGDVSSGPVEQLIATMATTLG